MGERVRFSPPETQQQRLTRRERRAAWKLQRLDEERRRTTRRRLLIGSIALGSLGVGGFALVNLSKGRGQSPIEIAPETDLEEKKVLRATLAELPPSPIKDFLLQRVLEYYQSPPPKTVKRAGIDLKVDRPAIRIADTDDITLLGSVTMRALRETMEEFYPVRSETMRVPYLGLVLEHEQDRIPKENWTPDGTPFVTVSFPQQTRFFEGIAPEITVYKLRADLAAQQDPEFFKAISKFTYIKEACTLLLVDLYLEETIKRMQELGFPTHIDARRRNWTLAGQRAAVVQAVGVLNNTGGRLQATIDIAGYLVGFEAIEDTPLSDALAQEEPFNTVISELKDASFGANPKDILFNSIRHSLTSEKAKHMVHDGNLGIFP